MGHENTQIPFYYFGTLDASDRQLPNAVFFGVSSYLTKKIDLPRMEGFMKSDSKETRPKLIGLYRTLDCTIEGNQIFYTVRQDL